MRENHLAYRETVRKYWNTRSRAEEDLYVHTVKKWECIYLTEGAEGFMTERRGIYDRAPRTGIKRQTEKEAVADGSRERSHCREPKTERTQRIFGNGA